MRSRIYTRIWFSAIILSFLQSACPQSRTYVGYREALNSQQKMLAAITDRLRENQHSVIIELSGRCYVNAVARSSPARMTRPGTPDDLANLLAKYGHFVVRDKERAATVIQEQDVTPDNLGIVLPSVALEPRDRNDPNAAIEATLTDDAVTSLLARRHILFVGSWEKLQTPPMPNPPLPSRAADASLEDTIQILLRAFPGIAVYQQCRKPNGEKLIEIAFERY